MDQYSGIDPFFLLWYGIFVLLSYFMARRRPSSRHRQPDSTNNTAIMVIIVVLLLIVVNMVGYWFITEGRSAKLQVDDKARTGDSSSPFDIISQVATTSDDGVVVEVTPREETPEVTKQLVLEQVLKHINLDPLPEGIVPVVAEIANRDVLVAEDPIFREAANGDYFILHGTQLVFYRPVEDKIILFQRIDPTRFQPSADEPEETEEDAVVTSTASQDVVTSTVITTAQPATIELRTGAAELSIVRDMQAVLAAQTWAVSVTLIESSTDEYTQTIVVDQTAGKNPIVLEELQRRYGGTVTTRVPRGESPSESDFVIIFGP